MLQDPELSQTVLDNLATGVCVVDRDGKMLLWNHGAELMSGHLQHELLGRPYNHYFQVPGKSPEEMDASCAFTRSLQKGTPAHGRVQLRHKEGHLLPVLVHTMPIRNQHGTIVAIGGHFDIEKFRAQDLRSHLRAIPPNCMDPVTGTATRGYTQFHLRENLAGLAEYRLPFGIIWARAEGLDHFAATYGYEARDNMIAVVGQDLSNCFRPADLVGRWSDDEFLAILPQCPAHALARVFRRIRQTISTVEIRWWGESLSLPLTLRCAAAETGDTIDRLLQRVKGPTETATAAAASATDS